MSVYVCCFYMNTCRMPHLNISHMAKRFTVAVIVLFSVSGWTKCALVVWDSEWRTVASLNKFWISTEVVRALLLYGWCHVKLLPSQHMFCAHHTSKHQSTVVSLYLKLYIYMSERVCECLRACVWETVWVCVHVWVLDGEGVGRRGLADIAESSTLQNNFTANKNKSNKQWL